MPLPSSHVRRLGAVLAVWSALAGAGAARAGEPAAARAGGAGTMPLSEVRPGMEGTVRTVFEGGRVEEFGAEIIGVMDNFLGPDQDLILARLKGDRVQFTGVAGGMSGSPVYIDGRLVGAVSYRMGSFLKEPIAGITPIEYMLGVGEEDPEAVSAPGAAASARPGRSGSLEPIETPLVAWGVPGPVLEAFAPDLERLGLGKVVAGAGGPAGTAAEGASRPLQPGDPVAAQLVRGDLSFAATGTVTMVDGDRVYAFGHPAFLTGATEIPMARAEVYVTLSSLQASSKLSRVLDTIGTFRQSRLAAMTGVIGPTPATIPVTLEVAAAGFPRRTFRYEVVNHREITPPLVGLVTAASLVNAPWFADELTTSLSGRVGLEGHPDLVLDDLYTGFSAAQSAATALARDVQGLFTAVYQNRFEKPRVTSIDLRISSVERGNLAFVEAVYPTRTELEPGQEVEFRVLMRPYRGDPYTRKLVYRVPEGTPAGPMIAYIGGASLLGAVERNILARQVSQADDLDQVISLINRLRTSDKLYMKIIRRHAGAIVQNEILPSLPPSINATLAAGQGTGEVTPLAETTIHEDEIALDQIIVGGTAVPLRIR